MAVAPGARIEVRSGDDAEQASGKVTNGVFRSADAGAVTLTLANGQVRTLERDAVRRVRVRRPFFERPAGWRAYLIIIGVMTGFLVWAEAGDDDIGISSLPLAALTMFPAALPFFAATPMGTIYEAQPQPPRLVMAVDVNVTEGAVVPRDHVVVVAMDHSIRARRPGHQQVGITACLSSHPERCTGVNARIEGRAGELPSPLTLRLRLADRFPFGTPLSMHVHVVIVNGSSWRPVGDVRVPRPGDPGVLRAATMTRRITVSERRTVGRIVNPPGLDCGAGSPVRRIPVRRINAGAEYSAGSGEISALSVTRWLFPLTERADLFPFQTAWSLLEIIVKGQEQWRI